MKQIEAIKELLNTEYLKAYQEQTDGLDSFDRNRFEERCDFIRYLQDQVNKITKRSGG